MSSIIADCMLHTPITTEKLEQFLSCVLTLTIITDIDDMRTHVSVFYDDRFNHYLAVIEREAGYGIPAWHESVIIPETASILQLISTFGCATGEWEHRLAFCKENTPITNEALLALTLDNIQRNHGTTRLMFRRTESITYVHQQPRPSIQKI